MSKIKAPVASLSGMMDSFVDESDVEVDAPAIPASDSNQENHEPPKQVKGRAKAAPARKGKSASKRFTGSKPSTATKRANNKRAALKEQANQQGQSEVEEAEDVGEEAQDLGSTHDSDGVTEEVMPTEPPKKKGRQAKPKQPPKQRAPAKTKATTKDGEFEYTPTTARRGKAKAGAKEELADEVIPEGQMDVDDSFAQEDEPTIVAQSAYRQARNARSTSRQPQPALINTHRRAGSASDTERSSDPMLRRKLGDMTKKFENLDFRYRKLREIGIVEAESNFERLKKHSQERNQIANDLIASLRDELATQKELAVHARAHQQELASAKASLEEAEANASQLASSLADARNEIKALQTKLSASRTAGTNSEKTPGSAIRGKNARTTTGSADATHLAQTFQLKEGLYSDLTGLVLLGLDRQDDAIIYDCIQTGRNGALHFKLEIPNDANLSNEETEIHYVPRLDSDRDSDLLEILPDYLIDEISFSSVNAAKFYSRVVDALTRN